MVIKLKVILCGSKGKTGKEVLIELKKNNIDVVYEVNIDSKPLKEILEKDEKIDYIIDFTNKNIAYEHIMLAIKYKIAFISGTTGWEKKEIELIKKMCNENKTFGIISPNFSVPINILFANFEMLTKNFDAISYIEAHHISKKDIPSGTAKLFKEKYPYIHIKSYKKDNYIITYHLTFKSKYDTMEIDYKVESKKVYAKGLVYCLTNPDMFYNLLK